jgi:hypothetical protein
MNFVSYWSLEYLLERWGSTISDPSFMAWFTAGSYFACAIMAFIAILTNQMGGRRPIFFWSVISLFMIFLGVTKQIDLQPLFTDVGRQIAKAFDQWQISQIWLIVAFGSTALVAFLSFAIIMRGMFRRFIFAFIGIFFLLSFIFLKVASIYHFDEILGFAPLGAKINFVLMLTGIYLILVAGIREIRENFFLKKAKMNLLNRLKVCGTLEPSRTVRKQNPRKRGRNTRASFVA